MKIDHWMTFGTFAQQRFFIYPSPSTYKGVIINANMVAHAPAGMAEFLLERTDTAAFIIDPLTHAFQHDPNFIMSEKDGTKIVKSSINQLAEEYESPFIDTVGKRPITPNDFDNINQRKNMVFKCINFQREKLQSSRSIAEIGKYLSKSQQELKPFALISPYFYLTETHYKEWIDLMKKCLLDTLELKTEKEKVFVALVISQGVLGEEKILDKLVSKFSDTNVDGFLIWVDNFDEQSASIKELKNFIYLCRKLKNKSNEIINLHGGYFSILTAGKLGDAALSGVAHGPEFGEYRSVIPVGGGVPIAKYYIPKLYSRTKYRDAVNILKTLGWLKDTSTFYKNVCSCEICKTTISKDTGNFILFGVSKSKTFERRGSLVSVEYPIKETGDRCLKHYLNTKKDEYNKAVTLSEKELLSELITNQKIFEKVIGIDSVGYLEKWRKAFN